jgi:hypothetical protein
VDGILTQYRTTATLGDGTGLDVMEVGWLVPEVSKLDVEQVRADIG